MRLRLFTTILYVSAFLGLSLPPSAEAAGAVTILGTSPNLDSIQPVNVVQTGFNFGYLIDPHSTIDQCWPDKQSINSHTVSLSSPGDTRVHPLYTVGWSETPTTTTFEADTVNYYHFSLSIPQPGYELLPNSNYTLTLTGGTDGITFLCKDGSSPHTWHYLPDAGYQVAFTTGNDLVAPIITEHSYMTTHNTAVLGWITSEPALTQIRYGASPSYGKLKSVPGNREKHLIELNNLQPGTTYYYQLESKDADGVEVGKRTGTFTTWSISPITISEITGHEATLRWNTSPATDSIIEYGTTSSLGQVSGKHGLTTTHDVRLVHLQSNQTYYARIRLINEDASSVSDIFTFKTLDAGAGVSTDTVTLNPQFTGEFDLSNFNFRDFPLEETSSSDNQASLGAVLAAQDEDLFSIAGNFGSYMQQHQWVVWLWVPVLLLIFLIVCVWLLHRHQNKASKVEQEIAEHKAGDKSPVVPPQI